MQCNLQIKLFKVLTLKNRRKKMIRNLVSLALIAIFFASCGGSTTKQADQEQADEIVQLSVDEFLADPAEYVGKEVTMRGLVVHVCKHGGKRMFIVGENQDDRLQIKAGDEVAAFPLEAEGSIVEINGIVDELRIDEAYLENWENELKADNPESEMKIHRGEEGHEHGEGDIQAEWNQIANYREQLVELGQEHLSFYSVICNSFVEIQEAETTEEIE